MLTLLPLLLAASPLHVVALHGAGSDTALQGIGAAVMLGDSHFLDASDLHGYLFRPKGVLPFQDFEGFRAGPARGWPTELAREWADGVAQCQPIAGPPPWKSTLPAAKACADRLAASLWRRFVEHRQAAYVVEVDAVVDSARQLATVSGIGWDPLASNQYSATETVKEAEAPAAMRGVIATLLRRKGTVSPRKIAEPMGRAGSPDPFLPSMKVTSPVTLKKTCPATNVTLEMMTPGPVGESLVARWPPVKGKAPRLRCELAFAEHEEQVVSFMPPTRIVTATLSCGGARVVAETASELPKGSPVDRLSEKLAQDLAATLCRG